MNEDLKARLHTLIEQIDNEDALTMLSEDAAVYAGKEKASDNLTEEQVKEIKEALAEVDKGRLISHEEFKKHTAEWIKKIF